MLSSSVIDRSDERTHRWLFAAHLVVALGVCSFMTFVQQRTETAMTNSAVPDSLRIPAPESTGSDVADRSASKQANRDPISSGSANDGQSVELFNDAWKPTTAVDFLERGWSYEQEKCHTKALRDISRAIRMHRTSEAYMKRAWVYQDVGQFHQAIRDATKAIQLDKNNVNAYDVRAAAYSSLGNLGAAAADNERSIRVTMRGEQSR